MIFRRIKDTYCLKNIIYMYIQNGKDLNIQKMRVYVACISDLQTNFSKNKIGNNKRRTFYCLFKNTKTKPEDKYLKKPTTY